MSIQNKYQCSEPIEMEWVGFVVNHIAYLFLIFLFTLFSPIILFLFVAEGGGVDVAVDTGLLELNDFNDGSSTLRSLYIALFILSIIVFKNLRKTFLAQITVDDNNLILIKSSRLGKNKEIVIPLLKLRSSLIYYRGNLQTIIFEKGYDKQAILSIDSLYWRKSIKNSLKELTEFLKDYPQKVYNNK